MYSTTLFRRSSANDNDAVDPQFPLMIAPVSKIVPFLFFVSLAATLKLVQFHSSSQNVSTISQVATVPEPKEIAMSFPSSVPFNTNKNQTQVSQKSVPWPSFMEYWVHLAPQTGGPTIVDNLDRLLQTCPKREHHHPSYTVCHVPEGSSRVVTALHHKSPCQLWVTEQPEAFPTKTPQANHVFTTVLDPRQHLKNLYFECWESANRLESFPATFQEWLQAWVDAGPDEGRALEKRCGGNPRNVQSRVTQWDSSQGMEGLLQRFDVVGDAALVTQISCLMFLRYTGTVHEACDCSSSNRNHGPTRHRRLRAIWDGWMYEKEPTKKELYHHAALDYQTTVKEDELMAQLTETDTQLYQVAREAFDKQLRAAEKEFGIQVCEHFPEPPSIPHFVSHIPKTGGAYAFSVWSELLNSSPEYQSMDLQEKRSVCYANRDAHNRLPVIGHKSSLENAPCNLWISEQPYTHRANHIYTFIRDPQEHVVSQYFHCSESSNHQDKAMYIPDTLEAWLQGWVDVRDDVGMAKRYQTETRCYNPLDMQSRFTMFDPETEGLEELRNRYTVIGLTSRMVQSTCVMFVRYAGWVPEDCDCSSHERQQRSLRNNLQQQQRMLEENNGSLEYSSEKAGHGVTHHAATYEASEKEKEMIAELTRKDTVLYDLAVQAFDAELKEVEQEYSVTICESFSGE